MGLYLEKYIVSRTGSEIIASCIEWIIIRQVGYVNDKNRKPTQTFW